MIMCKRDGNEIQLGDIMMLRRMAIVLAMVLAAPGAMAADTAPATSQAAIQSAMPKELATTLDDAIKLLEAGKNRETVELLLQTTLLAEIQKKGDMDKLVEGFAGKKSEAMLKMLRAAKGQSPKMSEDGGEATFAGDAKAATFIKEDGQWHIKDSRKNNLSK
jgi:hypothetical protein